MKNRTVEILISKYPTLNKEGDCVGVSGYFIDISGHTLITKNTYPDEATGRLYLNEYSTDQYLTPREIDILKLLMTGYRPKKIASLLSISKRTVDEHIGNIKIKLNCHTNSDIVPSAFAKGLHHLTLDIQRDFNQI